MPTPTYDLITTTTLAADTSQVVFASLPQTYRDLILVSSVAQISNTNHNMRLNGDAGSNYIFIQMMGLGGSTSSNSGTLNYFSPFTNSNPSTNVGTPVMGVTEFLDYSATDKHKTMLLTNSSQATGAGPMTSKTVYRWVTTAAITTIVAYAASGNIAAGSTFSLYGIVS
jgi:hypothetical protein